MNLRRLQRTPLGVRELCCFLAVAEELHFARAAERVGINQSPLSKRITLLEQRLGVRLFVRTRKGTRLDVAGKLLLEEARKVLGQIAELDETVRRSGAARDEQLNIALAKDVADPRIARLLAMFRAEAGIAIECTEMPAEWQLQRLALPDHMDVAFFMSAEVTSVESTGAWVSVPLWTDHVVLAMPPDHPLAADRVIHSIEAGMGTLYVAEHIDGQHLEGFLVDSLLKGKVTLGFVDSVEQVLTRVVLEPALGLLAASQAESIKRDDVVFRPLARNNFALTTYVVHRAEKYARSERHAKLVTRLIDRAVTLVASNEGYRGA